MIRAALYLASAVALVTASVWVPMPLVETAPGASTSIPPLVEIGDEPATEISGDLGLLTVLVSQPSLAEALRAWPSPVRALDLRDAVIPPGVDRDEYFRLQRRQFTRSFDVAAAVGVRATGEEVEVGTAAYVAQVLPGGPSDGVLETGDLFVALEGERVETGEELVALLRAVEAGDEISLTVERGNRTIGLRVDAGQVAGMDQPGLGVLVETVAADIDLPFDVEMTSETDIGGPSAGLMIALTVYDLLSDDDLTAGRTVVGTGTIDGEGRVGRIGGITEKVAAAERAGADVLLVPDTQLDAARGVVDPAIELHGVATIEEAIDALSDTDRSPR